MKSWKQNEQTPFAEIICGEISASEMWDLDLCVWTTEIPLAEPPTPMPKLPTDLTDFELFCKYCMPLHETDRWDEARNFCDWLVNSRPQKMSQNISHEWMGQDHIYLKPQFTTLISHLWTGFLISLGDNLRMLSVPVKPICTYIYGYVYSRSFYRAVPRAPTAQLVSEAKMTDVLSYLGSCKHIRLPGNWASWQSMYLISSGNWRNRLGQLIFRIECGKYWRYIHVIFFTSEIYQIINHIWFTSLTSEESVLAELSLR